MYIAPYPLQSSLWNDI